MKDPNTHTHTTRGLYDYGVAEKTRQQETHEGVDVKIYDLLISVRFGRCRLDSGMEE